MSRYFLIPLTAIFLASPATIAPGLMPGLSEARAATNLNSSRSNRKAVKSSKSNTSERMRGGKGAGAAAKTTTVKSSKSNTSD